MALLRHKSSVPRMQAGRWFVPSGNYSKLNHWTTGFENIVFSALESRLL